MCCAPCCVCTMSCEQCNRAPYFVTPSAVCGPCVVHLASSAPSHSVVHQMQCTSIYTLMYTFMYSVLSICCNTTDTQFAPFGLCWWFTTQVLVHDARKSILHMPGVQFQHLMRSLNIVFPGCSLGRGEQQCLGRWSIRSLELWDLPAAHSLLPSHTSQQYYVIIIITTITTTIINITIIIVILINLFIIIIIITMPITGQLTL